MYYKNRVKYFKLLPHKCNKFTAETTTSYFDTDKILSIFVIELVLLMFLLEI